MSPMDPKRWKRGGRQRVLSTYLKLHEPVRLGEHWLWVALERVAAGEKEDDVLVDYGYRKTQEGNAKAQAPGAALCDRSVLSDGLERI